MIKKILVAAMLAASVGGIAVPASAAVYIRQAPPAPRVEAVPAARRGYTWAPGYWNWSNRKHVWVAGQWVRNRPGYRYNASQWTQREDGRWTMQRGNWKRGDRDGDGVPNRQDSQPDNPRRN